jgi:hypothetical protein
LPARVSTGENSAPWQGTHNIFIERLWRSLKYEDVFIKASGSVAEARRGIGGWLSFYDEERLHQALGYRTPRAVFDGEAHEPVDNASALDGCGIAHWLVHGVEKGVDPCGIGSILRQYFVPLIGRERETRRDSLLRGGFHNSLARAATTRNMHPA